MEKQNNTTFLEELKTEHPLLGLLLKDYDLCSIRNLDFIMRMENRIVVDVDQNEISQNEIRKYLVDENYTIIQVGSELRGEFDYDPTLEEIEKKKDTSEPDYYDIYICRPMQ